MKLFKIFTIEIIFYIILIISTIIYYMLEDINIENQTDLIISAILLIIVCTITASKISDKIKSLKKKSNSN